MTSTQEERALDQEAAGWFARLNRTGVSAEDRAAFRTWAEDPRRAAAYDRIETIWRRSGAMAADPDIQRALAQTPFRRRFGLKRFGRASAPLWWGVGFATAGALALAFVVVQANPATQTFATDVGERRLVRLEDGSGLQLDTSSTVQVRLTGAARELKLVSGQALFDVAPDARRPFRVQAGDTRVIALGTRFGVRRDGERVRVTLMHGRVDVVQQGAGEGANWTLKPGEQLAIQPDLPVEAITPRAADTDAAESWAQGRLVLREMPLSGAVAEINRYSRAKIRIAEGVDRDTPVSGVFDTDDSLAFAGAVASLYDLDASSRADGEIVIARP